MTTQAAKAELFLKLHQNGGLLLPNAWDIASARVFEQAGFPAIATTSAGIAFANGYPDGEQIGREEMLAIIARMVAAVEVPVTADIEAGYGDAPEAVATTIRGVIEAGAVGVNLEDNTHSIPILYTQEAQVERIAAAREEANRANLALVINARIDTYLAQVGAVETRLEETLQRARAYRQAGADCIFLPGVYDAGTIEALVKGIAAPLNILVGAGAPSAAELFKLGVARISVGSAPMLATMGLTQAIARELREHGTYEQIGAYPYSYGEATKLLATKK